ERRRVLDAMLAQLRSDPPDMVVSSGTDALVLTSLLAADLQLPMAYLRPKPKEHGRQQRVEGELRGTNIALIAVEPTAETVQDNIELAAANGAKIARVVAVGSAPSDVAVPVSAVDPHLTSPTAVGEEQ